MARLHASPELYQALQRGARAKAELFDSRAWAERFAHLCTALRDGRPLNGAAS